MGRESEYLKIGVELKIVGNGLVDNVLLEMGVRDCVFMFLT